MDREGAGERGRGRVHLSFEPSQLSSPICPVFIAASEAYRLIVTPTVTYSFLVSPESKCIKSLWTDRKQSLQQSRSHFKSISLGCNPALSAVVTSLTQLFGSGDRFSTTWSQR